MRGRLRVRACVRACILRRFNALSNERSSVHKFTQIVALQFENLSYEGKITDFIDCFKGEEEIKGRKSAKKGEKNRMKERDVEAIISRCISRDVFYWCDGKLHKNLV